MKSLVAFFVSAILTVAAAGAFAAGAAPQPIPGRYIVVYKESIADPDAESARAVRNAGGVRHHTYTRALKGFTATLSDAAVLSVRNDPKVAYVEQDQEVSINDVQQQATWGLDRIDQVDLPLDTQYQYDSTGAGVYAFIVDSGIRSTHTQFGGRVVAGYNVISDNQGTNDCNGHGTHVAGTVGGTTYGVAKRVTLVPVRVVGCNGLGRMSDLIAGIDWVMTQTAMRPAVANVSLGGPHSAAADRAIASAVAARVTVVVAAGNDNVNACTQSPAGEPTAITVGATTRVDARASFSNWGPCLDLFAPGANITSAWSTSDLAITTISGTSMAAPHVTGVAALVLSAYPAASPVAVTNFILANATPNRIASAGTGSPNLLLNSLTRGTPVDAQIGYMAVVSITGSSTNQFATWQAEATVTIHNVADGKPVVGAVVNGTFAPGGSGACTTNHTGRCLIESNALVLFSSSTSFTVTDVQANGFEYAAARNAATQLMIHRRR